MRELGLNDIISWMNSCLPKLLTRGVCSLGSRKLIAISFDLLQCQKSSTSECHLVCDILSPTHATN